VGWHPFVDTDTVMWCEYGSYALGFAMENDIPYYYLTPVGVIFPSTVYRTIGVDPIGTIFSSIELTNVTTLFTNEDTGEVLLNDSRNPESRAQTLAGLFARISFADLPLGHYRIYITASTELSSEVMVDLVFEVKNPPLAVRFGDDSNLPSPLINVNTCPEIYGTMTANAPMTRVTAVITRKSDGQPVGSSSITPNASSCSLGDLVGNMPALSTIGEYVFRLEVSSASETITAYTQALGVIEGNEQAWEAFDDLFRQPMYANPDKLATVSALFALECYDQEPGFTTETYFGFSDRKVFKGNSDNINYVMMYKDIQNPDGTWTRLWAVGIEGTTPLQWTANFRLEEDNWTRSICGDQPGGFHAGFYAAADRVFQTLKTYRDNRSRPSDRVYTSDKYWITGHSRGAAAANILAGYILPNLYQNDQGQVDQDQIYCYCFACPNVTQFSDIAYRHIRVYNIKGDLVPRVPLESWGYDRYGETVVYDGDTVNQTIILRDWEMDSIIHIAENIPQSATTTLRDAAEEIEKQESISDLAFLTAKVIISHAASGNVLIYAEPEIGAALALIAGDFLYGAVRGVRFDQALCNTHAMSTYFSWMDSVSPLSEICSQYG